uniref:Nucleoporin 210 like n=1 Tax=Ornithorhynchus anatinus TaxID=9258 RepID=A0A6I8N4G0_ORNAN
KRRPGSPRGDPRPPAVLLLVLLGLGVKGHKLNVPQVLLPFGREPGRVPFVLEAERGCYTWRSTHHDVVTVRPLYSNGTVCSQRAVLVAESTQPTRLSGLILARDVVTDHELRCDVKVDVIAGIEIVSRTRELYVDDAPLELAVRALDAQGNTFSSLAGMAFDWSLARDDESESVELTSRIRVLRYSEAEYSPPDYIAQMEAAEKQGDRILVSGIGTGAAVLKVRVHEPFYKNLAAASIRLLVLENVFLIPAHDVFLLVGAYIRYRVARVVQGKLTEVVFPLEHYELVLQNHGVAAGGAGEEPVARLDERSATVTAVQLGRANLIFVHKNVHMRAVSGLPNCSLHVVEAGFLGFTVHPGDRWSLEVGQTYVVTVEVYDKSSMKVYMSDNLRVAHRFPEVFFEELMSTANGSFHVVRALRDGVTLITASLTSGAARFLAVPIGHEQEVKIYLPIKLSPAFLAFPHHPATVAYRYQVQVEGGSGNFTWTSSNDTVATVTIKGIVMAGPVQGNSSVQARDFQNPFRYGEIWVLVLPLSKLELRPFHADVAVGHVIEIPVVMYHTDRDSRESLAFTDCSLLALDVTTDKRGVFAVPREGAQRPGPTACSSAQITAQALGHALVTVRVTLQQRRFEGSATFAAYEPLKAVNPVEVALVAWRSSKEVVFEGGPGPWVLEPSRFFLELSAERPEWIGMVPGGWAARRKQNQYAYWVHCLQLGEQVMLMFRVGNHPGVLNPHPAVETARVVFVCAHPASLAVSPVYRVRAGARPCPLPQHNKQLVPVSSLRDTILELTVLDRHRRKFDNFSSLLVDWRSSNRTLASFDPDEPMDVVAKGDGTGQTRLHGLRLLRVHRLKGTLSVRVVLRGYREDDAISSVADLPASVTVELLLVEDVTVVPENAIIYNHPAVRETFDLVEGSGYFLVTSREEVVAITYREPDSFIQVVPIQTGLVTLEVYDLCLTFLGPARLQLRVANLHELVVDVIDKVEVGKSVPVRVRVLGRPQQPFRKKYFRHMELRLQLASDIAALTPVEEQDEWTESHLLRALAVGQTTLVAVARDKEGRKLTSAPRQIEVFPPFRLVPEKITLVPTNMVQVSRGGGPQPQSLIDFTISNKTVALVNHRGQVTARAAGTAVVHGTIRTVNEDTGLVTVFSQDEVEVEVVQLRAVRILAATTRLVTDTEMPIYVMGLGSAQTPFSFGNANPGLTFHWAVTKRDVLDLEPRQAEVSVEPPAEVSFAAVVRTRASGRTSVRVTVRCPSDPDASAPACTSATQLEGGPLEFSDEVQILVFEKLQLLCPDCPTERVLMSMNSQFQLHTNREGAAVVSSRILKCFPNSSVIEEDGQGLLRAGAVAGSAVLEVTSREPFGVNQTAITGVQVAPVTYLQISTAPRLFTAPGKRLAAFPLGAALTFTVHLYDSVGERFHTHSAQLHLALNRDDLLLIGPGNKNHTYVAQAVNRGVTLVAVRDLRHPGMADYIPVPVECAIEPDARLAVVGDVVCFGTHLVGQGGEPGLWVVSPASVLQLDVLSGAAVARSQGTATVFYEIPGLVRTYQEVTVNASSRLMLSYDPKTFLTNTPNSGNFRLLISTSRLGTNLRGSCSPLQESAIKTLLLPQTLILCHVQFSNTLMDVPASRVFHVLTNFSVRQGLYECLVGVRPQAAELLRPLSVADTAVYAWVSPSSPRGPGGSQRLLIPFVPAFFVNRSELLLSRAHPAAEVRVLGVDRVLEKLEVWASSPVLAVQRPRRSPTVPGLAIYPVRAVNLTSLRRMTAPVFINVSCPLTRQRAAVPVRADPAARLRAAGRCEDAGVVRQLVGSYQILLFTLFAVLASTAVIFLTYNAFLNRVQTVPVVYVPTPTSSQTGYPYPSGGPYVSPQPPLAQSRLQHWLWSVRH